MKNQKILLLGPLISVHFQKWILALLDLGKYDVKVLTMHPPIESIDSRIDYDVLPYKGMVGYFLNKKKLHFLVQRFSPNLFHAHYASGYGYLGRDVNVPYKILSVWGSDVHSFPKKSSLHKALLKKNIDSYNSLVSTSLYMQDDLLTTYMDLDKQIDVIGLPVDSDKFKPTSIRKSSSGYNIGTVRSLEHVYGLDRLLYAFEKLHNDNDLKDVNFNLTIIGSGSLQRFLVELANKLNIGDSVHFKGRISQSKLVGELNAMDIFLMPSRSESFGVAGLEAASCGVPVVGLNLGGIPEIMVNGKTGVLVKNGSDSAVIDHLYLAIKKLILDPSLLNAFSENARNYILENHSVALFKKRIDDLYQRVLS